MAAFGVKKGVNGPMDEGKSVPGLSKSAPMSNPSVPVNPGNKSGRGSVGGSVGSLSTSPALSAPTVKKSG